MTENEILHSLNDTFVLCDIHMERMMYAFEKTKHLFPLTPLTSIYDHLKTYTKSRSDRPF